MIVNKAKDLLMDELNQRVLIWIDDYFKGRSYKPNREVLSKYLISDCLLVNVSDVEKANNDGNLSRSVEGFICELSDVLQKINKGKVIN